MKRRPVILSVNNMKHVNHKIVITGESRAMNCAADQHSLSSTFAVSSFVKPGAGMRIIVDTVKEHTMKPKNDYIVVIWAGSNDFGKNNEALKHVTSLRIIKR